MTRRTALLLLFALVALPGTGCYHLRCCMAQFRANHPCLFPCANSCYPMGCGSCGSCAPACDGCATSYSGPGAVAQPYPGAMFGTPQPITNFQAPDPKAGIPNPMK